MTAGTYWRGIDRFRAVAAADPERAAVLFPSPDTDGLLPRYSSVTYQELDEWSDAIAEHFTVSGIHSGTRTVVLVLPSPELFAIVLGLFKVGAVPVVIDPGMGLRKMLRCLRAAEATAFIGTPHAHLARIVFRHHFLEVKTLVTVGRRWLWRGESLRRWARRPAGVLPARIAAPDDELLLVAFTTGSTGPAKAVALTHGNVSAMVDQVDIARSRVAPHTSLITLPLVGVLDLVLGSRCVLPPLIPSRVGATDPVHVVDAINRFGVRTMFASPAVLIPLLRYLQREHVGLPTVQSIFSGGAPVPDWCITGLRTALNPEAQVFAGYGATEALPIATIESRELFDGLAERAHHGDGICLGRPVEHVRARIVVLTDEPIPTWARAHERAGELAATRGIGELVVAGPNVSTSYYWPRSANVTGKIADGDLRWHRTGDLARIDEEGRIWFCGRKSQRVETTTGPMFTVQVEQIFTVVPGVARTALVGIGPRGAQQPVLCVELAPGADRGDVAAAVRQRAAKFELTEPISEILFHPAFPVDIRHNSKIGREQLTRWATAQLSAVRR